MRKRGTLPPLFFDDQLPVLSHLSRSVDRSVRNSEVLLFFFSSVHHWNFDSVSNGSIIVTVSWLLLSVAVGVSQTCVAGGYLLQVHHGRLSWAGEVGPESL